MNSTFSFYFHLKKKKDIGSSVAQIYIRMTCNGQRVEISTGRTCETEHWNPVTGRTSAKRPEFKALNIFLDTLQSKLYAAHQKLIELGLPVNA